MKNAWCAYGLGELKDGIWKDDAFVARRIGPSKYGTLRRWCQEETVVDVALKENDKEVQGQPKHINTKGKEQQHVFGRLLPPSGLKNLGATCYLNVLIQVIY